MRILITGGAGFIGINAASRFIKRGEEVIILDNLSREGSKSNLKWLRKQGKFQLCKENLGFNWDSSNSKLFQKPFDVILHLAAQAAVTSSIIDPLNDFDVNACGTLLLLDNIRRSEQNPILIFSSTNKVYGNLEGIKLIEEEKGYRFADNRKGIDENQPLDLTSPYGCSKGCADQYVRDFARIYGMKTVVLRQSCIYGLNQFGIEGQGWLAWFIISHLSNKSVTVYGNGKQMRDILYIDDLLDCYDKAIENADAVKGEIYNVGGGPENQLSLLEFFDIISDLSGKAIKHEYGEERKGDQKIYVSDITKVKNALGWHPRVSVKEGILRLYNWIKEELC